MVESPPQYTPRGHGCKYQSCFQNIHWSLPGYTAVTGCFWAREYAEHSPQAVDTCPLLITSEWPLHFLYISRGDLSSAWDIHPECSILLQFPLTLIRKSSPWCSLSIWHCQGLGGTYLHCWPLLLLLPPLVLIHCIYIYTLSLPVVY